WSSDVCSSDLEGAEDRVRVVGEDPREETVPAGRGARRARGETLEARRRREEALAKAIAKLGIAVEAERLCEAHDRRLAHAELLRDARRRDQRGAAPVGEEEVGDLAVRGAEAAIAAANERLELHGRRAPAPGAHQSPTCA